ncbi:MAG TPA: hypothetical protein VFA68_21050 [Terriglobales bacterium]|nr:hypothetical protein [Terriglobales bacterium]
MNYRCANPACDSDYFHPLRLRAMPMRASKSMMILWLCDDCCDALKLDKKGLPRMQPRRQSHRRELFSVGG